MKVTATNKGKFSISNLTGDEVVALYHALSDSSFVGLQDALKRAYIEQAERQDDDIDIQALEADLFPE